MQGRIHVRGDSISRVPTVNTQPEKASSSNIQIHVVSFQNSLQGTYKNDQFLSPILKELKGIFPDDTVQTDKLKFISPSFQYDNDILYYNTIQICVSRSKVKALLRLAHESPIGPFFFLENKDSITTLSVPLP